MSSIASADVLERRSSGHTQDQFTGYCPQPSSLMQGDGEEMTGSGRTPYSDDKLMPKSATDGVSFMDETAQSQSFALDASPIPQQHSQMGLTLQEEEEEGGEEDGGMHGHPPAYHEQGQHTLTADSYGDLLADIDDLNFGTANPHSHEHDYMPTESSDMDISKLSVGERLYYIGCGMERNKQERLRREREHQVVSELSQVTAKPMITQRARELANKGLEFPEKSVLWSKRLEKERRKQSAKHCMDNIAENLQTVQMNPRSAAMLERGRLKNSYKSPIKGWNTHFARYQTKKNVVPEREVFAPNINTSSSSLHREGVVGDRLHEEACRKNERLQDMMDVRYMQELVDPASGMPYFQPNICRTPSRDVDTVVHTLLSKGEESRQKREKRTHSSDDAHHSFQPVLNSRSQEIVSARGRRPLYDPQKFSKKEKAEEEKRERERSKKSTMRVTSYGIGTQSFHRRNERLLISKQERVRAIKREQEQKELEHCTFTPRICRQSEEILMQGQSVSGGMPVRSRSAERPQPAAAVLPKEPNTSGADLLPPREGEPWGSVEKDADPYVGSFEREMLSVLEEWRKLEEV